MFQMKVVSIKEEKTDEFREMDPFRILDRKDVDISVRLGALLEDEDGDIPAGLLLAARSGSTVVIVWLYVTEEYRRKGLGERLLYEVFRYAARKGCTRVAAFFSKEYGRDMICTGERDFFTAHGFFASEKNTMDSDVIDYLQASEYKGPTLLEEGLARYLLFGGRLPEE